MIPRLLFCALLTVALDLRAAPWANTVIPFLGRPLVVSLPANYRAVARNDPRRADFAEWLSSQNLTMAGWFVADATHSVVIEDYGPSRGYRYSPEHWAQDVQELKASTTRPNARGLSVRPASPAGSGFRLPAYARLGMPRLMPVYDESSRHYSCRTMTMFDAAGPDGATEHQVQVTTYSQIYLAGRLVTLSVNASYPARYSHGAIEAFTREIIRRLQEANPD